MKEFVKEARLIAKLMGILFFIIIAVGVVVIAAVRVLSWFERLIS